LMKEELKMKIYFNEKLKSNLLEGVEEDDD
jgi:hypothetical protein